jgi:hypothetical protein
MNPGQRLVPCPKSAFTLCADSADRDSVWQLKSDGETAQELIGIGCPALYGEFLLNVFVHVIASRCQYCPESKVYRTHAFISSMVRTFFVSSTLYVGISLFTEKPILWSENNALHSD